MNTATEETRIDLGAQMAELSAQIAELRAFFANEPLAYGMAAACEAAQLSRPTMQRAINEGRLRIRRSGRKVLIDRDELRRFLASLPA